MFVLSAGEMAANMIGSKKQIDTLPQKNVDGQIERICADIEAKKK